jgi:LmbE family N-acetylglucosaminyl deacetylase
VFLGYDDGQLQPTLELRRDLVRVIRDRRPEVVLAFDPTMLFGGGNYINHPDHRAAAQATLDAVAPACEMPLLWPEVGAPHRISKVYVHGSNHANAWVDISSTIDKKIEALKEHASQMGEWDPTERIKEWNSEAGEAQGIAYAEGYRVITFRDLHTDADGDEDHRSNSHG